MFPLWRWLAAPRPSNPKASDLAQPWCRFWGQWSVWSAAAKNSQLRHQSGWGFEPWDLLTVWPLACNLISQKFSFPIWKMERNYLNFRVSMKIKIIHRGFPGGPVVKNPLANAGDRGSIPGPGRACMHGAAKPMCHNSRTLVLQLLKPTRSEPVLCN